jgi:hypothetical protein
MMGRGGLPSLPLFLVEDETLCVTVRGHDEAFRLRVWRTQGEPAVVLVSQVPGFLPPSKATEKIANAVKEAWLRHDPRGMFYFERNGADLQSVNFVPFGHGLRSRLTKPKHRTLPPNFLDEIVGHVVES